MRQKIKQIKKEKKGMQAIEAVIGLLIMVLLVGFLTDMAIITNKKYVVSQLTNSISRTIATQGGVGRAMPEGFQGDSVSYMTSAKLYHSIDEQFKDNGVNKFTVNLIRFDKFGNKTEPVELNSATTFVVDHMKPYELEIKYDYKWTITGQLVPGLEKPRETVVKRGGVSEFKYDLLEWEDD